MIISERIYEIMRSRNMSQKSFSRQTGIAQSTVSDWKTKKINPSADKILTICEVLQVSPQELLAGSERPENGLDYTLVEKNTSEYEILEMYRRLSLEGKESLAEYLRKLV